MVSIVSCLRRIKQNPQEFLDRRRIEALCENAGYRPRDAGPLDPATTIALFMQQVLQGNVSCAAVRHLGEASFTSQAYCAARMRLPLAVIRQLACDTCQKLGAAVDAQEQYRFAGHRVLLIDGSSFSMPDTPPLQRHFGQPGMQKRGCGFPMAHWLVLFNARSGLAIDALSAPMRTHEASQVDQIQQQMQPGDLVVGDDSFGTYAHLCLLQKRGAHGLFPTHHHRIVDFTPHRPYIEPGNTKAVKGLPRSRWVKRLGHNDQLVEWFKPRQRPQWMTARQWRSLPDSILVRELRRTIHRSRRRPITLTIVTTLSDPKAYPAKQLFQLRLRRWDVETDLRHLKTTMKMDVLHCQTVQGVLKEMWIFLLVYNLVRMVMLEAATRQKVSVQRISFADALSWMRHAKASEQLPTLRIVPYRPDRIEPRAVKRRHDRYTRMTKPRWKLREEIRRAQLKRRQTNRG
jgi:Transposase DDE domain